MSTRNRADLLGIKCLHIGVDLNPPARTLCDRAQRKHRLHNNPEEIDLSFIYLIALIGVSLALFCALAEAIWSVSRKPAWNQPRHALSVVTTWDRRSQALPFVGVDRRHAAPADQVKAEKIAA